MDVNNIQQLNNLGNLQQQSLERIGTGLRINSASDDASSIYLSDLLQFQRSGLSQSISNLNQGIAVTNIADRALGSQIDILSDIRTKLLEASTSTTSPEAKDAIQQEVQKQLEAFSQIADSTSFANQQLLSSQNESGQFTVTTSEGETTLNLPTTDVIAQELQTLANDFSDTGIENLLNKVDSAVDILQETRSEFGSSANEFISQARSAISSEAQLNRVNSSLTNVDFGKEVSDFNKTNIQNIIGYIIASQANANQERNVGLLS